MPADGKIGLCHILTLLLRGLTIWRRWIMIDMRSNRDYVVVLRRLCFLSCPNPIWFTNNQSTSNKNRIQQIVLFTEWAVYLPAQTATLTLFIFQITKLRNSFTWCANRLLTTSWPHSYILTNIEYCCVRNSGHITYCCVHFDSVHNFFHNKMLWYSLLC